MRRGERVNMIKKFGKKIFPHFLTLYFRETAFAKF